jgi:hypothetical protein
MRNRTVVRCRLAAVAFGLLALIAVPARSQNNPSEAEIADRVNSDALQVADYKKLMLVVMDIGPNPAKVTEDAIKTHAEMRLKAGGIVPGSDSNDRFLLVGVHIEGGAFSIYLGFYRSVSWELPGGKVVHNFLETWNAGDAIGVHGNSDAFIMKELDSRLDSFVKAYLKANEPKK